MAKIDVYENCPTYETKSWRLRLIRPEDAEALMSCYSDREATARMNTDHCTGDFFCATIEDMNNSIRAWLDEYKKRAFVRLAVIPKTESGAAGTIEIFGAGDENGVLRIDLAKAYDKEEYIEELLRLVVLRVIWDFQIRSLKVKVGNTPDRIPLWKKYGFVPSKTFRPELGYYERPYTTYFDKTKGVAFCGLACCVCSENKDCAGCRNNGCSNGSNCKCYQCCKDNELAGCWKCEDFPCDNAMLKKLRVRAFARLIQQQGEETLMRALKNNEGHGVIYHYDGELIGDYDLLESEEEIFQFIMRGYEV